MGRAGGGGGFFQSFTQGITGAVLKAQAAAAAFRMMKDAVVNSIRFIAEEGAKMELKPAPSR